MRKAHVRGNRTNRPVTLDGSFRRRGQAGTGGVQVTPSSNLNDPFGALTENLLPSSENPARNWSGHWVAAPYTLNIPDPFGGTRAMRVQGNVNRVDGNGVTQYDTGYIISASDPGQYLVPGQNYTLSVWLRSVKGTQRIAVATNDSGGQTFTVNATWQLYTVTVTHAVPVSQGNRVMQIRKLDANNPDWEIAFPQVNRGSVRRTYAPTFGDGPVVAGGMQNLLTNSDTFSTNWSTTSTATRTLGVADPRGGTTAVRVDFAGTQANECLNHTGVTNAVAGRSYVLSAWVRLPSGSTAPASGNVYLGMYGNNADPDRPFFNVTVGLRTTNVTSTWQRVVTAPILATASGRIYTQIRSDNLAWAVEVWGVQLEEVDPAVPVPRPLLTNRTGAALTEPSRRISREIGPATSFGLESGGRNLLTLGDLSGWSPTSVSATAAAGYAPDGTKTAVRITPDTANVPHMMRLATTALGTGMVGLLSAHFKAGEYRYARLCAHVSNGTTTTYPWAVFDLQTGTVTSTRAVDGTTVQALRTRVVALPNGWYRCAIQVSPAAGYALTATEVGVAGPTGQEYAAHDGVGGILAWGPQYEAVAPGFNLDLGHRLPTYAPVGAERTPDLITVQPGVMDDNERTWLVASRRDSAPEIAIRRAPDGGGLESLREMQFSHNMESNTVFVERSGSLVNISTGTWNGKAMKLTKQGVFGYQFGKRVYSEPAGRPYTSPYTAMTTTVLMLGGVRASSQWLSMWQGEVAAQLDMQPTEDGDIAAWSNNVRTALVAAGEVVPSAWKLQTAISSTRLNELRATVLAKPRTFGYDTASPAVLLESSRANLLSRSEIMETTTIGAGTITVLSSTLTTNADGVAERRVDFTRDVANCDYRLYPNSGAYFTVDKTKTYTFSVELKIEAAASACEFYVYGNAVDSQSSSQIRLFNVAADNSASYPLTGVTVTRRVLADGWVRYVGIIDPLFWSTYAGSGNSVSLWAGAGWTILGRYTLSYRKFQFEDGPGATSYVPTSGTAVRRTADVYNLPGIPETYPGVAALSGLNYISRSEDFTANWVRTNVDVTWAAVAGPNGRTVGTELTLTGVGSVNHTIGHVFDAAVPAITNGETVTFSFYAKAGTCSKVAVELPLRTPGYGGATFDLAAGTFSNVGSGATARITSAGNGWYRCEVTRALGSGTAARMAMLYFGNYGTYSGEDQTIYLYGAQYEPGSSARTYRRTAGAPALEGNGTPWTIALAAYGISNVNNQQHLLGIGTTLNGVSPDSSHAIEIRGGFGYNGTFNLGPANMTVGVGLNRAYNYGNSTFALGKWTTFFITYDGTAVRWYLNGALVWTVTDYNFSTQPTHAVLGGQLIQDKQFHGLIAPGALGLDIPFIDPVKTWTDAEISAAHTRWTAELAKVTVPVI